MSMIELDKRSGLAINTDDLSSMRYVDTSRGKALELTMKSGQQHLVPHWPYDGADIYELRAQILASNGTAG